eukprot:1145005-Pelagomonas_calceolata.AAC.2
MDPCSSETRVQKTFQGRKRVVVGKEPAMVNTRLFGKNCVPAQLCAPKFCAPAQLCTCSPGASQCLSKQTSTSSDVSGN